MAERKAVEQSESTSKAHARIVACAIGWAAACAAFLAITFRSQTRGAHVKEYAVAGLGVLVAVALALMKLVPLIPGHFTIYEWIALGIWIALGALSHRRRTVNA